MRKITYITIIFAVLLFNACSESFLEIVPPNDKYEREIFTDIARAQSFLNPAYNDVIKSPWLSLEYCTDNAVSNSSVNLAASSGYSSESSPVEGEWNKAFKNIIHINTFLEMGFEVPYNAYDSANSVNLQKRIKGEAYGLRAYYKWLLLKNFAGPSSKDPSLMLGFPIIDDIPDTESVNQIERSSYMDCYLNISKDLDSAMVNIGIKRYIGEGDISGAQFTSRISGEMIYALKARMALYAASPAYEQISWEDAADTIYAAIEYIDAAFIKPVVSWGNFNDVKNPDHFWRVSYSQNSNLEKANLPPSLFGRGECNPSQNLVNAFADANGYPIDDIFSTYSPSYPLQMRDPRLDQLLFCNGDNAYRSATIETFVGGADAAGGYSKRGSRTGYYMKKFLSANINLDKESASYNTSDYKIYPVFTRAGLYLDFAEAATNAYGLTGKSSEMMFSAVDALRSIRQRGSAFILDDYLDMISIADQNAMIKLIAQERRIEFAFEGERYYDVRRLMLPIEELNEPVKGLLIEKDETGTFSYDPEHVVEQRVFTEKMYYNPIPREEILKSNALVQNSGWED